MAGVGVGIDQGQWDEGSGLAAGGEISELVFQVDRKD